MPLGFARVTVAYTPAHGGRFSPELLRLDLIGTLPLECPAPTGDGPAGLDGL